MAVVDAAFLDDTALIDRQQEDGSFDISTQGKMPVPLPTSEILAPLPGAQIHDHETIVTPSRCSHSLPNPRPYDPVSPSSAVSSSTAQTGCTLPSIEESTHFQHRFCTLRWRLASGYFAYYILSWADGVTGTVLPYLKADFNLSTMTLSLLWGGSTCGYFAGTFFVETFLKWLGRFNFVSEPSRNIERSSLVVSGKRTGSPGHSASRARHLALIITSVLHATFFAMMGSKSGFPVMFVAYAVAAFARAILTAILNAYFASGPKQALGYAYGLAGIGAMASPLVCQSVITTGVPWFHFYLGSLVLSALNVVLLAVTFRPNMAEYAKEHRMALNEARARAATESGVINDANPSEKVHSPSRPASNLEPEAETNKHNALKKALFIPVQSLFSAFALLYSGSETTTQGFMVTYLLATKHANPKTVGFVTSGFWAGLSVGRFCWGYCNERLTFKQRKHVILSFICKLFGGDLMMVILNFKFAAIGSILQVLVWVVRSHVQNSIATAFIGLFYGPIVPAALAIANDVLPRDVQMVAMALINAFASLGAAVFPFVAGTVLNYRGVAAFPFITVPLAVSLIVLWGLFPSRAPSRDTLA